MTYRPKRCGNNNTDEDNSPKNLTDKNQLASSLKFRQLIKEEMKKIFPEVFSEGLGRCTKMTAKIKLKKNVQPVFRKKRSIPFTAIDKIDKELENVSAMQSTLKSDWAAPVVYVKKKSGEIRVCADFSTGLNSAIEDHHYPLPSSEEIFTKLNGGRDFSKIDLSEAYLQIPTHDESSKLLCISTHRGLFKYERLPFGVKTAPAVSSK